MGHGELSASEQSQMLGHLEGEGFYFPKGYDNREVGIHGATDSALDIFFKNRDIILGLGYATITLDEIDNVGILHYDTKEKFLAFIQDYKERMAKMAEKALIETIPQAGDPVVEHEMVSLIKNTILGMFPDQEVTVIGVESKQMKAGAGDRDTTYGILNLTISVNKRTIEYKIQSTDSQDSYYSPSDRAQFHYKIEKKSLLEKLEELNSRQ